ncbi:recombinase family protein [Inediibacterium massiliense]|uniref:recombinase family protein n=1 Tax=Inediibacterium massiliense TaxID=1658111 RepID=UPI0006B5CB93|nr:recombinase family protein [Inediibacterium massiliense]
MNIGIYSRKSKFSSTGESIQNQIKLCKKYAYEKFKYIHNFLIYEDEGFSGSNAYRPAYEKMLQDAQKKNFSILICYRLDRISRNVSDFSYLMQLLKKNKIEFISLKEQFDTSTSMGKAMLYISSVFSQFERETIQERIKDHFIELSRTGRWLGGMTPTGYESIPTFYIDQHKCKKKMYQLTPIEKELKTVKLLFDKFLEFHSLSLLKSYCIKNRIHTKTGKNYSEHSLKLILTNPVYAIADTHIYEYFSNNKVQISNSKEDFTGDYGIMVYNKKIVQKGKNIKTKDMSDWICAIGNHKGIIKGKDWIYVQKFLNSKKTKYSRQGTSETGILSGLLICAYCNEFMKIKYGQRIKNTNQRHFYYVCSNKSNCHCPNLSGSLIDQLIIDKLKEILSSPIILNIDFSQTNSSYKNLLHQLNMNNKKIENLSNQVSLYQASSVSKYVLQEIKNLYTENKQITFLIDSYFQNDNKHFVYDFHNISIDFSNQINYLFNTEKKIFLTNIIDRIYWNGEEVKIYLST